MATPDIDPVWASLERRLDDVNGWGRRIDSQSDTPDAEWKAWETADNEIMRDIQDTRARSLHALRVKAKAIVSCYGASAVPDDICLGQQRCTDAILAESIVRDLLATTAI